LKPELIDCGEFIAGQDNLQTVRFGRGWLMYACHLCGSSSWLPTKLGHLTADPDYDVIGEPEPAALLTCLDVARIAIGGNDGPTRHRFRDVKASLNAFATGKAALSAARSG
jgi:hypothetical protein